MKATETKAPTSSKRELVRGRLSGKHPDSDFGDEEVFFGQINDDYDDYEGRLADYEKREQALSDLFTADPRSAAFLTDWRRGGDPVMSLIRTFGTDIREALDDPEQQEAIAEANKEYLTRVAENKKLEEEYQKNIRTSLATLDKVQAENGLSDDDVDGALSLLLGIVRDGIVGKFTPESIDLAMKAIHHDRDVTVANEEGEMRGKNSKIVERLRHRGQNDGTAQLDGNNNRGAGNGRQPASVFEWAAMAK